MATFLLGKLQNIYTSAAAKPQNFLLSFTIRVSNIIPTCHLRLGVSRYQFYSKQLQVFFSSAYSPMLVTNTEYLLN